MRTNLVAGALFAGLTISAAGQASDTVLAFDTMAGVSGPYVGAANPIRGIAGGGLPWRLEAAKGELNRDGKLEIKVRGLVLAAGPNTGTNPAPNFRGVVSCQIIDSIGQPGVLNVSTGDFPANAAGDSDIEARLELPSQCFAPIVFVTNSAGRWFSITGY
jgi:hypothetical protein